MKNRYVTTNFGILDKESVEDWRNYYTLYLKGNSTEELSDQLKISRSLLIRIFRNLKFPLIGKDYIKTNLGVMDKRDLSIWKPYHVSYINGEFSIKDIAKTLDISYCSLSRIFKRFNLSMVEPSIRNTRRKIKIDATIMSKYGVTHILQSKDIKNKIRNTNLERRGVEYPSQCRKVRDKIEKVCIKKYGVSCVLRNKSIKRQISDTLNIKYGVSYCGQIETHTNILKGRALLRWEEYLLENDYTLLSEYSGRIEKESGKYVCNKEYSFKHNPCGNIFKSTLSKSIICPHCCRGNRSKNEIDIHSYIISLGFEVETNNWNLIKNPVTGRCFEIDLYIPKLRIAFEYNGWYWHREVDEADTINLNIKDTKPNGYHDLKTSLCKDADIRLYHLWESRKGDNIEELKQQVFYILNVYLDNKED